MKTVNKPWGKEEHIENNEEYCGKLLYIDKGSKLSWQFHILKKETIYVQSGQVLLKYSGGNSIKTSEEIVLNPKDSFTIPRGMRHQMIGLEESVLIEFSTAHYDSDTNKLSEEH
jgi:mannose-6-phosphate isomerase